MLEFPSSIDCVEDLDTLIRDDRKSWHGNSWCEFHGSGITLKCLSQWDDAVTQMEAFTVLTSHTLLRHLDSWYLDSKKMSGDEFSKNLGQRLWPDYSHPKILIPLLKQCLTCRHFVYACLEASSINAQFNAVCTNTFLWTICAGALEERVAWD